MLVDFEDIYYLEIEFEVMDYLEKLRQQFHNSKEPALVFHLAVSIYFVMFNHYPLYFTGKFVPEIVGMLEHHLERDSYIFLLNLQKNIMAQKKTMIKLDDDIIKLKEMLK